MVKIPTRVLLVDDEKDFVEMLSLRLQEAGEKVPAAYSERISRDFRKKQYRCGYPGYQDARYGWHRDIEGDKKEVPLSGSHHAHRTRQHRNRCRGNEIGGL